MLLCFKRSAQKIHDHDIAPTEYALPEDIPAFPALAKPVLGEYSRGIVKVKSLAEAKRVAAGKGDGARLIFPPFLRDLPRPPAVIHPPPFPASFPFPLSPHVAAVSSSAALTGTFGTRSLE